MILAAGATFALAASAHAAQKTVAFNVAPGSCGAPIAVPANNRPVILAGTNTQQTDRGEGQVTLLRALHMWLRSVGPELTWLWVWNAVAHRVLEHPSCG
jgi:hypothetical protein